MTNQQTLYFRESVYVKSYIDFSDENYQECSYSDIQKGIISIDAAMQLLEPELKKKEDIESIPVLIIPKTLPNGVPDIETPAMFPLGILYIPALLSTEGNLLPPKVIEAKPKNFFKAPWIPRDLLKPFNLQETAIGEWEKYPEPEKTFSLKDFQSWENYLAATHLFYENALGIPWTAEEVPNCSHTGQLLHIDDTAYIISDSRVEAKHSIQKLYDYLADEKNKNVKHPLYDRLLAGEENDLDMPYPADSIECMRLHNGQMGGEYPLSTSQRESINHFHALSSGEVLAVSGPPGTGKTTLLQSVVADMLVSHALKKKEPPIIVATSTNNQAVTNIIDSFGQISESGMLKGLEMRWIQNVDSFAAYFPSKMSLKKAQSRGYICTSRLGEYSHVTFEDEDNIENCTRSFLKACSAYFDCSVEKAEHAITLLHGRLTKFTNTKNSIVDCLKNICNITQGMSYSEFISTLTKERKRNEEYCKELEKQAEHILAKIEFCKRRYIEWNQYYHSRPFYIRLLARFFSAFQIRLERDLRIHMSAEETTQWIERTTLDDILQYYMEEKEAITARITKLNQEIEYTKKLISKAELCLKEVERWKIQLGSYLYGLKDNFGIDVLYAKLKKAENPIEQDKEKEKRDNLIQQRRKAIEEVDIKAINDLLDITLRYASFWLAVHYYESRWLSVKYPLSEKQKEYYFTNIQVQRFYRMAHLTPCMVMTFFRLPHEFETQKSTEVAASYLFNYIDLLIVDEAGQVSPEVALPSFALARKAIVVGDEEQIPPVWEIKPDMDVTLAKEYKLIKGAEEFGLLEKSGLNCCESSIMKVATMACRFSKDGQKGMFLSEHRRCYDEIISFCNKLVYKGRLQPCRGRLEHDKKNLLKTTFPAMGHFKVDVSHSERRGSSRYNTNEAEAIVQWINRHSEELRHAYPKAKDINEIVGIITPFKAQTGVISHLLPTHLKKIRVGTIHTFQGAECPIIILSTVYGGEDGCFFIEKNRSLINVAVSRAKDFFFIFSSVECLSSNGTGVSGLLRKMTEQEIQ